jgi:hypothetical protein
MEAGLCFSHLRGLFFSFSFSGFCSKEHTYVITLS